MPRRIGRNRVAQRFAGGGGLAGALAGSETQAFLARSDGMTSTKKSMIEQRTAYQPETPASVAAESAA